jgi:hypothetical protein
LLPCHSGGLAGQWVGLAGRGSLVFFIIRVHGGSVLAGRHAGRERRGKIKEEKKQNLFFLPLLHVQGKKKEEQCRSKRHRSDLFFF